MPEFDCQLHGCEDKWTEETRVVVTVVYGPPAQYLDLMLCAYHGDLVRTGGFTIAPTLHPIPVQKGHQ